MGLDISLYRISKPSGIENRIYTSSELYSLGLNAIPSEYLKYPAGEDLAPYCQTIKMEVQYIDVGQIRKDYGLPESAEVVMQSGDGSISMSKGSGESGSIDIGYQELEEKYLVTQVEDYAAFQKTEVAYWRKDYAVSDFFSEHIQKKLENTGYSERRCSTWMRCQSSWIQRIQINPISIS